MCFWLRVSELVCADARTLGQDRQMPASPPPLSMGPRSGRGLSGLLGTTTTLSLGYSHLLNLLKAHEWGSGWPTLLTGPPTGLSYMPLPRPQNCLLRERPAGLPPGLGVSSSPMNHRPEKLDLSVWILGSSQTPTVIFLDLFCGLWSLCPPCVSLLILTATMS